MSFVDFDATLRNFDGDLELFGTISKIFLEDAPIIVQELNQHVKAENLQATSEALHRLKGLVANFHATDLVHQIASNEASAKEGRLTIDVVETENIARQVDEISSELRMFMAAQQAK